MPEWEPTTNTTLHFYEPTKEPINESYAVIVDLSIEARLPSIFQSTCMKVS